MSKQTHIDAAGTIGEKQTTVTLTCEGATVTLTTLFTSQSSEGMQTIISSIEETYAKVLLALIEAAGGAK